MQGEQKERTSRKGDLKSFKLFLLGIQSLLHGLLSELLLLPLLELFELEGLIWDFGSRGERWCRESNFLTLVRIDLYYFAVMCRKRRFSLFRM